VQRRVAVIRLAALVAAVAIAFVIGALALGRSTGDVRDAVQGIGWAAPVAFVALSAALTVALFPFPIQAAAAGVLFGVAEGTVVAVIGGTLGALAAFTIARLLGRAPVEELAGERVRGLLRAVGERGFAAVLLLRVVPGIPRDVVNYACGLTTVGAAPFALATLIGIAPRAYAYVALGGSLGNLGSTQSLVAVGLLVGMGVLGLVLLARERRRS
jgi:uncharacterized membrane protein YdjX (TVP38/TMEM64 family)